MATTRTTTTKTKTKPAKKPTPKPATKPSPKPKAVKTVTKTTSTTTAAAPAVQKAGAGKCILIAIILIAIIAVVAGVVTCVVTSIHNNDTVMIENGNGDEIEARYVSLDGYDYKVLVPSDFKELTATEIADIYGNTADAPSKVYANEDSTVNIALAEPTNTLKNDDVEEYLDAMKTILATSMKVVNSEMVKKDDYNIGILSVISELDDQEVYNQMAFFSYDGKLAIVSFNCRENIRGEWEKVGNAILGSIKF